MGSFHLGKQVGSLNYWRFYCQRGCGSMEIMRYSARGKLPVIHSSFNLFAFKYTGAAGGKTYPSSSSSKLLTSWLSSKMMLTNITFLCSTPKPILFQTRYLHDVNPPKQGWFDLLRSRFKNKYMETVPFTKRTRFIPFSLNLDRAFNLIFKGYVLETNYVLKTILEAQKKKRHPQNKHDLKVFLDTHPQSVRLKWILHDVLDALGKNMDMKDVNATTDHLQGLRWQIFIIDHPYVSAFCISGGIIFIYRGLLQHFSSDGELAMIIGHEVGHIVARHIPERVTDKVHYAIIKFISFFFPFNLIPMVDITSKIQQLLRDLDFYPQLHEMEADYIGLILISSAGYDPRIAPKVFEKFSQLEARCAPTTNPVVKKLAKRHPSSEKRAHLLNQFMGQALNIQNQVETGHWILPRSIGGLHLIRKV